MGDEAAKELFWLVRERKAEIAAQTAILQRMEEEMKDKEKRIRELELENAKRKGIMAVIAAIGGIVGSIAVWIIKHFFGGGS